MVLEPGLYVLEILCELRGRQKSNLNFAQKFNGLVCLSGFALLQQILLCFPSGGQNKLTAEEKILGPNLHSHG